MLLPPESAFVTPAGSRSVAFPAVYNGVSVVVTATAYRDQVSLVIAPGQLLEVQIGWWRRIVLRLLIAAATSRD